MTVHSLKYKMAASLKMDLLIAHDKTDNFWKYLKRMHYRGDLKSKSSLTVHLTKFQPSVNINCSHTPPAAQLCNVHVRRYTNYDYKTRFTEIS